MLLFCITHPLLLKLLPDFMVHLLIDFLEVAEAGLPPRGCWSLQTTEEQFAGRRWEERHLDVLGDGEVRRKLTSREHILWRKKVIIVLRMPPEQLLYAGVISQPYIMQMAHTMATALK